MRFSRSIRAAAALALVAVSLLALVFAVGGGAVRASRSGDAPNLSVADAWAREGLAGGLSAVYLTIANAGDADDVLTGATCDLAGTTEIHRTAMEGGMMRMGPAGSIVIPAGGSVAFQPGGYHIMLMELKQDLSAGMLVPVTLQFEGAGALTIEATVRGPGA